MKKTIIFSTLSAKYVHASPAPYCLAAGVKQNAPRLYPSVRVVEGSVNESVDAITERLLVNEPAFVGLSCYIWNIGRILEVAERIKKASPETVIALGGPEVSPRAEDLLDRYPQIDLVFCGEGEESLPDFLEKFDSCGRMPPEEILDCVAGLCYRRADGKAVIKEGVRSGKKPPSPLEAGYAEALNGRIAYFESSRECPYSCAYCLSGKDARPVFFEGDDVLDNLLKLAQSGTRTVKFIDRTFNANAAHADRILAFILEHYGKEIPEGVTFHFEVAGDVLRESTLALLERMPRNAVQLEVGIQSFNPDTLKAVRRQTDLDALEANLRRLIGARNMHVHIDLIAGLPHEDIFSFKRSFNKAFALGADMLQLGFLKVIHGSAMRCERDAFPCTFDIEPPYEVISTPYMSSLELSFLHLTEDALDRLYNSSRFKLTLQKALDAWTGTPFDFFSLVGLRMKEAKLPKDAPLESFIAFFLDFCDRETTLEQGEIRDALIIDRLASNNTGHLPSFLFEGGEELKKVKKRLSRIAEYREMKGVRRGYALIKGGAVLCIADYSRENYDPIEGRYALRFAEVAQIMNNAE